MELGNKIAKERGIKRGVSELIQFDSKGKIKCACAAGMALIGKFGVEELENSKNISRVARFHDTFNGEEKVSECLIKEPKGKKAKEFAVKYFDESTNLYNFIWKMNDVINTPVSKIVEYLKNCGY